MSKQGTANFEQQKCQSLRDVPYIKQPLVFTLGSDGCQDSSLTFGIQACRDWRQRQIGDFLQDYKG